MYSSDYFMRHVDQLGKALAKLLADLVNPENTANASIVLEDVSQTLQVQCDIDLDAIAALPADEMIATLKQDYAMNDDHFELLGDLFFEAVDRDVVVADKRMAYARAARVFFEHRMLVSTEFSLGLYQRLEKVQRVLEGE